MTKIDFSWRWHLIYFGLIAINIFFAWSNRSVYGLFSAGAAMFCGFFWGLIIGNNLKEGYRHE